MSEGNPTSKKRVYALFTGEYEQRCIHSVHSTRVAAEDAYALLQGERGKADIEDYEVNPVLCRGCGYSKEIHDAAQPHYTVKHPFQPNRLPDETTGEQK